jgi:predicted DCC family thiol-disulfide oxidoreductase YuxK
VPRDGDGRASRVETADAGQDAWLIYDGDCPFCSRYVQYVRVRDAIKLRLVNARDGGPLVDEIRRAGLDLDGGMVLKLGNRFYHGADCIHVLALLGSTSDVFNRVNAAIFRSESLSRLLYPVLRAGRNTVLRLLGRRKLGSAATD